MLNLAAAAVKYRSRGFSVIPVGADKKPIIEWKAFQQDPACQDEIEHWWETYPDANVGIVTGKVSGLVVLDLDGDESLPAAKQLALPETWVAKTGRGWHVYFRHPGNGTQISNRAGILPHLDVRGDGGYVIAPPSVHPSGTRYAWIKSPEAVPLAELPANLLHLLMAPATAHLPTNGIGNPIPQGQRNDALYRIARGLLAKGLSPAAMTAALLAENGERCQPPMGEAEVRAIAEHAATQPNRAAFAPIIEPAEAPALEVPAAGMIGVARTFADLYATYLESPLSFFYFAFLTYFGALVAKMVTLQSELRPEPRLFTMLLGESADTRKSTALRKADHFFKTLGPEWQPAVLLGVGSAEGLAAALKDQPDHSLLLHLDEAKSFVDKARAESSVLLPMVTTLFERHEYDNRTKEGSVSVRGVSLSILGACTGDTYSTMFDPRFFSIGFLNRLFLVADHTTVKIPIPQPVPANALAALRTDVIECLRGIKLAYERNGAQPVAYEMTPGAVELYRAWYEARTGSVFERRLDTYGHRLMVLLTATTGRTEVDEEIMGAVLALLRYQLDARRECDPVDCDNAVATLEERIRRSLARGGMRARDLQRKLHTERVGVWMWKTAVQNLLGARELKWDQKRDFYTLANGVVPTSVPTPMGTLK